MLEENKISNELYNMYIETKNILFQRAANLIVFQAARISELEKEADNEDGWTEK